MSFIGAFAGLRICLFRRYHFVGIKENLFFLPYSFNTSVVTNNLRQLCLPQRNGSFPLHFSDLQGTFYLGHMCQNSEVKI